MQIKISILIVAVGFCSINAFSQDNTLIEISGQVLQSEKKIPLPDENLFNK